MYTNITQRERVHYYECIDPVHITLCPHVPIAGIRQICNSSNIFAIPFDSYTPGVIRFESDICIYVVEYILNYVFV